jgi:Cys-rich repeat protein
MKRLVAPLLCGLVAVAACDGELRLDGKDGGAAYSSCTNGKCPIPSLVCAGSTCVECNADGDCHDPLLPRCDTASHRCVQCGATADCMQGFVCESQTKRCLPGCTMSAMCMQGGYRDCDMLRGYCVACATSSQCPGGEKKVCDVRIGQCVECLSDGDCTDSERHRCDPVTSRCVRCLDNSDCHGSEPICNIRQRECEGPISSN